MSGHTMFECCARCGRATIDVVDDECRTCGYRNRPLTPFDLVALMAATVVVAGAVAVALGVG